MERERISAKRHQQLDRHLNEGKAEGDPEGIPEVLVFKEHALEVLKTDPLRRGKDVVIGKGGIQRGEERNDSKNEQADDERKDKDITRHFFIVKRFAQLSHVASLLIQMEAAGRGGLLEQVFRMITPPETWRWSRWLHP